MRKYRFILAIGGLLFFGNLFAQHEEVKRTDIINSLNQFFDNLSSVNDEFESIPASVFARIYGDENVLTGGGHYFRYNGQETRISSFVQSYARNSVEGKNINHTLDISNRTLNVKPINGKSSSDQRWQVKGTLIRSNAHFKEGNKNEDYLIKSIPVELVVRYNGSGKEVSILEINMNSPRLQKVYPQYREEIVFTVDNNNTNTNVPSNGGQWYCSMHSYKKRIKFYPGFDKTSETQYLLDYNYDTSASNSGLGNVKMEKLGNGLLKVYGTLASNYSEESRTYSLNLIQKETGEKYSLSIIQPGTIDPCAWCRFFRVDNSWGLNQINLSYSLKYGIGLAYKHHFEETRFSLGGIISFNFDVFRGIEAPDMSSRYGSSTVVITTTNIKEDLYEMEKETVKPNSSNYSNLLDPKNEAKQYTSRSLFMIEPGVDVTNWFNFTLGLGIALSTDKYFLETAYGYTKYSYKKLDPSLPDIDDVYDYKAYYKDYYYMDPTKCHFAIRPAMDFRIPIDRHQYLNLGVGYVITPGFKDGNSLDFSIGYTFR